jgi:Flp pilus assembly protein TadG
MRAIAIRDRLRRARSEERGTVLVLVAVTMVAFLGLAALAIDIGSFYQAQRQAQSAADAGALAGADALATTSAGAAATVASNIAKTNYSSSDAPIVSEPTLTSVKVTVNAPTSSFFGRFVGLTSNRVSATAVATETSGGGNYAVFAKSTACGALQLQQGNLTLNGAVHSNGGITASGHTNTYTSGSTGACSYTDNSGGSNTFGTSTTPASGSSTLPWPADYTSDFPVYPLTTSGDPNCTSVGSDLNLQNNNPLLTYSGGYYNLPDGVYCYSTIEFNIQPIKCTCTFVAGSFQLNQGPDQWSPYYHGLMFYDVNDTSLNVNSNGPSFLSGGVVFAPNASLTVNAPSGNVSGAVEALTVTINGGGPTTWTAAGGGTSGSGATSALTQ